jgi:hypothetical protein
MITVLWKYSGMSVYPLWFIEGVENGLNNSVQEWNKLDDRKGNIIYKVIN